MRAFEYRQAEEIREALKRHNVRYLFIGKSGAILLGFPDTTQDADLFVERSSDNGRALVLVWRSKIMIKKALSFVLMLMAAAIAGAQTPTPAPARTAPAAPHTNLKVGDKAPDFTLASTALGPDGKTLRF